MAVAGTTPATVSPMRRPVYDRTYPPLKRFSWVWRMLATYWSFVTWAVSVPWLVVRWLAPANLQDNLSDVESSFLSFTTPVFNFVQDSAYRVFHLADYATDWAMNTASHFYTHNLKGFEHTFDHFLRNLEHRVRLLKDNGLSGIGPALSLDISKGGPNPIIANTPLVHTPLAKYE